MRCGSVMLALLFMCHRSKAVVVPKECSGISVNGNKVDLTQMTRTHGSDFQKSVSVGAAVKFEYRVNVCANTVATCNGQTGAVTESLVLAAGKTVCRVLGRLDKMEVEAMEFPASADNPLGEGVRVKYKGGDICGTAPAERRAREAWVEVKCSIKMIPGEYDSVGGTVATDKAGELVQMQRFSPEDLCRTVLQMASWFACSEEGRGMKSKLKKLRSTRRFD